MSARKWIIRLGCCLSALLILFAVLMFSGGAFGVAYYLDSDRTVIERVPDPNSSTTAQIELEIMGGAPLSQVKIKPWWKPDWGITLCTVAEFYADTQLEVRWLDANRIEIQHSPQATRALINRGMCNGVSPVFVEKEALNAQTH